MLVGGSFYVFFVVCSYVGGESFWLKGQKDVIYYFIFYVDLCVDEDFCCYEEVIVIFFGDCEMCFVLDQFDLDIEVVCQGIFKGGNYVDDVIVIIWLYCNFYDFSYFECVIELWLVGDKYVMELIDVVGKMCVGIGVGQVSVEQV